MTDWLRVQNDLDVSGAALSWTPGGPIGNGITVSCDVWLPTTTVASIGAAGTTASWFHIAAGGHDGGQILGAVQGDLSVLQKNSKSPNAAAGAIPKSTSFNASLQLVHTTTTNWTVTVKINGSTVDTYTANLGFSNLATLNFVEFGGNNPFGAADEVYFVSNCVVLDATSSPWFSDDLSDVVLPGTLGPWTAIDGSAGDLSIVTTPADSAGGGDDTGTFTGPVRVGVAFPDGVGGNLALDADPVWTYLTDGSSRVASYTIDRGRQFEFDKTDAGTATVAVNDLDGTLDPTNTAGPYFGKLEPLIQIRIELWNPVTLEYQTRFRGWIEDYDYTVEPFVHQDASANTEGLTRLQINCVDIFEILTAIEMQPDGSFGDNPTTASYADATGNIFFAVTDGQGRIDQVMGNAGINVDFYVAFTLNIDVSEAVYSPSENVLQVIQDVADAEFPTVANVYTDRFGRLAIHGRLAKFDPATVAAGAAVGAWDFTHWKAGDGKAVTASPTDTAHIRTFAYNRGLSMIRNAALCTPNHIDDPQTVPGTSDIPGQYVTDTTSIGLYGIRSWSAENLFVEDGILTGNTKLAECLAFANFIKANYAGPRNRITEISFKSIQPTAEGAAANWDFLCRADISDLVDVTVRGPGDTALAYIFNAEPFFIEGVHEEAVPANGDYAMVTLSLDLSPQAYFTDGTGVTS